MNEAGEFFFRYRPIKAALHEHHELENDEIYFSTTEELNDPLEGFRDLIWQGDDVVWRNLLKHYFLCSLEAFNYCLGAGDAFDSKLIKNIVYSVPQEMPDAPIREMYQRLSRAFLSEPAAQAFVQIMSVRQTPVRRYELMGYLRPLHAMTMQHLVAEYCNRGILLPQPEGAQPPSVEKLNRDAIAVMEGIPRINPTQFPQERVSEALSGVREASVTQLLLINEHNMPDREQRMALTFYANHFPSMYVNALEKLVHRDWYVACFAPKPDDPAMWNNYTAGHRGICLIFKPNANSSGDPSLKLLQRNGINGAGKYVTSFVPKEISPVVYTREFPPIDFFSSFGVIPEPHVNGFWYRDEETGRFSTCREKMYADIGTWRKNYWDTFRKNALTKTPEWEGEKESRIVFHTDFDAREKKDRKLKYKFEDLAGIVFGANTEFNDRLAIMKIVDRKCKGEHRKTFRFHEMRYLHTEGRFQLFNLDLIKFKT